MAAVYVASPLGFSMVTRPFYAAVLEALGEAHIKPIDPWDNDEGERLLNAARAMPVSEDRYEAFRAANRFLGAANDERIRAADAMLAILDGVDVDSGTAAEIGFAAAHGKPIIGLRLDTRQAGDNEGATVNMQVEHFIRSTGGDVFHELNGAIAALVTLLFASVSAPVSDVHSAGTRKAPGFLSDS